MGEKEESGDYHMSLENGSGGDGNLEKEAAQMTPVILTLECKFCENKVFFIFTEVEHTEKYTGGRDVRKEIFFFCMYVLHFAYLFISLDTQCKKFGLLTNNVNKF